MPVSAQKYTSATFCPWEQTSTEKMLLDFSKPNIFDISNYTNVDNPSVYCKKMIEDRDFLHRSDHVVTCDELHRHAHLFCLQSFSKLKLPGGFLDSANKRRLVVSKNEAGASTAATTTTATTTSSSSSSQYHNYGNSNNRKLVPRRISATSIYDQRIGEDSEILSRPGEVLDETNDESSTGSDEKPVDTTASNTAKGALINNGATGFLKPHRSSTQLFLTTSKRILAANVAPNSTQNQPVISVGCTESRCAECASRLGNRVNAASSYLSLTTSATSFYKPLQLETQQPQQQAPTPLETYKKLIQSVQQASAKGNSIPETISTRNLDFTNKTNIKLSQATFTRRGSADTLKRSKSNIILKMSRLDRQQHRQQIQQQQQAELNTTGSGPGIEGIELSKSLNLSTRSKRHPLSADSSQSKSKQFYVERKNSVCINSRDSTMKEFNENTSDTSLSTSSCSENNNNNDSSIIDPSAIPSHEPLIRTNGENRLLEARMKSATQTKKPNSSKMTRTKYVIFSNNNNTSMSLTHPNKLQAAEETNITLLSKPPIAPTITRSTSLYSVDVQTCKAVVAETRHLFDNIRVHGKRVSMREQQNKMPKITFEVASHGFNESNSLLNSVHATEIMTKK